MNRKSSDLQVSPPLHDGRQRCTAFEGDKYRENQRKPHRRITTPKYAPATSQLLYVMNYIGVVSDSPRQFSGDSMKRPEARLFSFSKVSEKQDRSDNVTGQRRQQNREGRDDKRGDDQGSHGPKP